MAQNNIGHIYVLTSPKTDLVKIGGTDFPPLKRIREVNSCVPYRELGPWSLADFRQVNDWRKVEASLHYGFRSQLDREVVGAKELFHIAHQTVSLKLNEIDPDQIVKKPTIDRMFQDAEFSTFIQRLFAFTGLLNWIDIQGAWTFVLFPGTAGGRYFTINIGPHEVAFSTLPRSGKAVHAIVLDRLIYDFPEVMKWVESHNGEAKDDAYASGLPRSVLLLVEATFEEANTFLRLDGVRRALLAYWSEALIGMKERSAPSIFARFHNWNAVAEIRSRAIGAT
jgi:hypothetical protein